MTEAAKQIVERYAPGREPCGVLTIWNIQEHRPVIIHEIGKCPPDKRMAYFVNSVEKAVRLSGFPSHLSSHQSRVPGGARYGGSIRTDLYIVSFSGLPELADEALSAASAMHFDWIRDKSQINSEFNSFFTLMFGGGKAELTIVKLKKIRF